MSQTLQRIQALVLAGAVDVSRHGLVELAADEIMLGDVVASIESAIVVEDYPSAQRGPSVLVLQQDGQNRVVHVLWGMPKGPSSPAILITAYRPDPARWSDDFMRRKR